MWDDRPAVRFIPAELEDGRIDRGLPTIIIGAVFELLR
jgi:hypothetical protein